MGKRLDIAPGTVFGRLVVLGDAENDHRNRRVMRVRCACGNETEISLARLIHGGTKTCTRRGHSISTTPTYQVWEALFQRCRNPNDIAFPHYGGRGIRIDPRWEKFEAFIADMGPRPDGTEIDRIDNNGNYEPGNCRWATRKEQTRNTRRNRNVILDGQLMCVADAAAALNLPRSTILVRVHKKRISHQEATDYYAARRAAHD